MGGIDRVQRELQGEDSTEAQLTVWGGGGKAGSWGPWWTEWEGMEPKAGSRCLGAACVPYLDLRAEVRGLLPQALCSWLHVKLIVKAAFDSMASGLRSWSFSNQTPEL